MKFTPVKTPEVAKRLFPKYIWDIKTNEKILYLSFDDGPTPGITEFVLDTLNEFNAKATFFCIGNNVEKHPEIYNRILKEGHAVGNHTHHHLNAWKHSAKVYMEDVARASERIDSKLFRPPYGKLKLAHSKQLASLNFKIVMWDVLSFDWESEISPETCLANVISKATKGSIVVFHDSMKAERNLKHALPKVLNYFSAIGFSFEKIAL